MNSKELAIDYLNEAKLRLKTVKSEVNKKAFAFSVRLSQEAVELSLKAALRFLGIDFPKWHDVGNIFLKENDRFPDFFQNNILKIASISKSLSNKRELAMYGDDKNDKSPSSLFNEKNAKDALRDAEYCLEKVENLCKQLLKEHENKK